MRWILALFIIAGCGGNEDRDGDGFSPPEDCCDTDVRAFPGQTRFFTTPINNMDSFDFDCNGVEEKEFPNTHECSIGSGPCADRKLGWMAPAVPECGGTAQFTINCGTGSDPCYAQTELKTQACH